MWILTKSRFNANWKFSKYYWIHIITTKFIIGLKMKVKIVEKCVMWLLCLSFLSWLKNPGDPNITDRSCPRLSTQVVFTAANLKTPLTCLSCLAFLLCVRVWARVLWYLSALESSEKERATYQGVTRPAWDLSLSYLSQSATVCLVLCESRIYHHAKGGRRWR